MILSIVLMSVLLGLNTALLSQDDSIWQRSFLAATAKTEDPQCFVSGICSDSQTIRSTQAKNENQCLKNCQSKPDCQWFTFDSSLELCLSFQNCSYLSNIQCPNCVSGQVQCQPKGCDIVGFCRGLLIQYDHMETLDQCQPWCDDEPNCNHFSFDSKRGICFLFHTCPEIDEDETEFITGHRGCDLHLNTTTITPSTDPFSGQKLLIVGGNSWGDRASVLSKDANCDDLANLPKYVTTAVGAFMDNTPVICSGEGAQQGDFSDQCHKYDPATSSWLKMATMNMGRTGAAAVLLDEETLWITGGWANKSLSSTEIIKSSGQVLQGIELEQALFHHCVTKTSIGVLFTGGYRSGDASTTQIYNYNAASGVVSYQKDGPSMNIARRMHGCTTFKNHKGRELALVVGGWVTTPEAQSSLEVWDFSVSGSTWQLINDLPVKMNQLPYALASPDGKGAILVHVKHVIHLKMQNGNFTYDSLPVNPQKPRPSAVAMFIPDSMASC